MKPDIHDFIVLNALDSSIGGKRLQFTINEKT
jgi:hypothetical protein